MQAYEVAPPIVRERVERPVHGHDLSIPLALALVSKALPLPAGRAGRAGAHHVARVASHARRPAGNAARSGLGDGPRAARREHETVARPSGRRWPLSRARERSSLVRDGVAGSGGPWSFMHGCFAFFSDLPLSFPPKKQNRQTYS